jgi:hypothetical protein
VPAEQSSETSVISDGGDTVSVTVPSVAVALAEKAGVTTSGPLAGWLAETTTALRYSPRSGKREAICSPELSAHTRTHIRIGTSI